MIKSIEEKRVEPIEIDLTGPEGNVFVLIGYANQYAKQLGYSPDEIRELNTAMTSSDYENAVNTFDKHFGHFVTLYK